jgi:hypothetical protein
MSSKKEKSSKTGNQNALKHGAFSRAFVLPDENVDELRELRSRLSKDLQPRGETEHVYFEIIVTWAWRLLRSGRWIKANMKGDDFQMATEIEIPARISGEFDRAVRRLFQFRATRKIFRTMDEDERDHEKLPNSVKALPGPHLHDRG